MLIPYGILFIVAFLFAIPIGYSLKERFKIPAYFTFLVIILGLPLGFFGLFRYLVMNYGQIDQFLPYAFYRWNLPLITSVGLGLTSAAWYFSVNTVFSKKVASIFSAMLFTAVFLILSFIFIIFDPGSYRMMRLFHHFNAHLKDVCLEREDMRECPKKAEDLGSYDREAWKLLNSMSTVEYNFDENTQMYIFSAQNHSMIIRTNQNPPGYFEVEGY